MDRTIMIELGFYRRGIRFTTMQNPPITLNNRGVLSPNQWPLIF